MTALTLAMIAHLAANPACSVPGMTPEFWPAVVGGEGGLDPLALHDDATNTPHHPVSPDAAEATAIGLMRLGHSVGVGLSQLTAKSPEAFLARFGLTIRDALEPCRNMHVGAKWYVTGALSTYNTGSPTRGIAYAQAVMARINPPPAVKAAYAAGVTARIRALDGVPAPPKEEPIADPTTIYAKPSHSGRDLVFSH